MKWNEEEIDLLILKYESIGPKILDTNGGKNIKNKLKQMKTTTQYQQQQINQTD